MKTTLRWSVSACALAMALTSARGALAQSLPSDPPPPVNYEVDVNHVDVITGALNLSAPQVSIGPKVGGLTRVFQGLESRDNYSASINLTSSTTITVSIGASSETFSTGSGGAPPFTSNQADGSTLTMSSGVYTYTTRDGTVATFSTAYNSTTPVMAGLAQIVSLTKPTGETLTYAYKAYSTGNPQEPTINWVPAGVSSNRGLRLSYSYQNNVYLSSITATDTKSGGGSQTWSYTTNTVQAATDPLGHTTSFGLPAASSTQTVNLASGATATVKYDSQTRVTSYSNGIGTWSYAYTSSGSTQTTTVTDPNGHKKTYVSNTALDVITSYTDALNRTTSYTYDSYGRLASVTHPHGDVVSYTYDEGGTGAPRGNVTTTTWTPVGGGTAIVTHASYDASCTYAAKCNKPDTTTDAKGAVTSYTYDNTYGVLLSVTKPAGGNGIAPTTTYTYTNLTATGQSAPIHLLTGISYCNTTASCAGTADQTVVTIAYDPNQNLAVSSVTTAAGDNSVTSTKSFTYDAYGNLATSTNPLGGVTTYYYDADRELVGLIGPLPTSSASVSAAARITYTPDGLVGESEVGTFSGAAPSTYGAFSSGFSSMYQATTSYDAADRSIQTATTGSGTTYGFAQTSYDNANNVVCTAVRMNPATFGSEPAACTQGTPGNDGADRISYRSYDASDTLTTVVDGYGSSTQRTAQSLTYNTDATLGVAGDGKGDNSCYGYDGFGRLTETSYPTPSNGASCNTADTDSWQLDANSNVTSRTFRDGTTQSYSYDALNQLGGDGTSTYAYDNLGRTIRANTSTVGVTLTYDALGRKTSEQSSYGGPITSAYDAAGDRTRLTYPDGLYVQYDYDVTGAMQDLRENGATSGEGLLASYTRDGLGRVTGVTYGSGTSALDYGFDNMGRLSAWSLGFGSQPADGLIVSLDYNPAGQVRTRIFSNSLYEWSGSYDVYNSYTLNGLNQITGTGASTLSYGKRGSLSNDGTNTYAYSIYNQLTSVSGSANATLSYDAGQRLVSTQGSATTRFVYDGSMIAEELDGNGNLLRRYAPGPDGTPVVWYEGASTTDRRWLLKDPLGSVLGVANGSSTSDGLNTYDAYGMGAASNIGRFQYASRPWIPEAGLYDNSARSYSPTLGRFLQTDPIGYADGMNWYAYGHDDPENWTDPTGTEVIGAGVGAVFGFAEGFLGQAAIDGHFDLGSDLRAGALGGLGGAAIGLLDPTAGIGTAILLGAGVGAGTDLASQLLSGQKFNFGELAGAGVGGALGGAIGQGIGKVVASQVKGLVGGISGDIVANQTSLPFILLPSIIGSNFGNDQGTTIPTITITGHHNGKSSTVSVPAASGKGTGPSVTGVGGVSAGFSGPLPYGYFPDSSNLPDFTPPSPSVCVIGLDC